VSARPVHAGGGVRQKPLAVDLYAGLGGFTEGLLAEGYEAVGFDIERHVYGSQRYPAQLVIQDVRTLHGRQFKDAALIVASPPCQRFSWMAMPWSRAKQMAREYDDGTRDRAQLTELFDTCFRIQREACDAAGRHIPLVVENVRGAQRWVGSSKWHYGSFHLWGDVPALMPVTTRRKQAGNFHRTGAGVWNRGEHIGDGVKVPSLDGGRRTDIGNGARFTSRDSDGVKQGGDWFNASQPSISRRCSSKSPARKAASAQIAKIPLPLSRWIARAWYPEAAA
jgi:C-5 cytosine-specific DNA methylase